MPHHNLVMKLKNWDIKTQKNKRYLILQVSFSFIYKNIHIKKQNQNTGGKRKWILRAVERTNGTADLKGVELKEKNNNKYNLEAARYWNLLGTFRGSLFSFCSNMQTAYCRGGKSNQTHACVHTRTHTQNC